MHKPFNLKKEIVEHPFQYVGGAVVVGMVCGMALAMPALRKILAAALVSKVGDFVGGLTPSLRTDIQNVFRVE